MIKIFIKSILLLITISNCYSSVLGPVEIDILGYSQSDSKLYFTRTDWSECDCETDLYIYMFDIDSVQIIKNWSLKKEYRSNKENIVKNKGLADLSPLDTTSLPSFISLQWKSKVEYFSVVLVQVTSLPFTLKIYNKEYDYYLCSENSPPYKIINYKINKNFGLVYLTVQGDCIEGNLIDTIIFYDSSKKQFSRKLINNDVRPLDSYKLKNSSR